MAIPAHHIIIDFKSELTADGMSPRAFLAAATGRMNVAATAGATESPVG